MHNPIPDILVGTDPIVEWLIPDLLPHGTIVQYAGDPGVGKSFFAYNLAMSVATQTPFLGFVPSSVQPVLYCDVENSVPDRNKYLRQVWRGLCKPDLELVKENFWTSHFELGNNNWDEVLRSLVSAYNPALVVIDTATPCFSIEDENNNSEASKVIRKLRHIQSIGTNKPTFLVLRHAKTFMEHEGDRKARGAQAWKGETDGTWFHVRNRGRPRQDGLWRTHIEVDKVRAFGLRETVHIQPQRINEGIKLIRVAEDTK